MLSNQGAEWPFFGCDWNYFALRITACNCVTYLWNNHSVVHQTAQYDDLQLAIFASSTTSSSSSSSPSPPPPSFSSPYFFSLILVTKANAVVQGTTSPT